MTEISAKTTSAPKLQSRIKSGQAVIGIIGLGYVGLPLLAAFHRAGFAVIGFDVDPRKIEALHRGENYLKHLGAEMVSSMKAAGRFDATADMARLAEADAILVCVPTPLGRHMEPDMTFIEKACDDIARVIRPGQLVVLESSTYPGTTREIMLPRFLAKGMTLGEDLFVAFSPEREDPGRKDHNTQTIPKLVGGLDEASGRLAVALYEKAIAKVIPVSSAEVAEAAKLLENIYRCVNIAMVNEMKMVLTKMGIDVFEVIEAAKTKPFGFQAFYPGPGLGGHCIPIDPYYLTWKAREVGMPTRFIELAGEINHLMPDYVVQRTIGALNDRGKAMRGTKVLVLGLAYKPDIDDVRESPSFELIERFEHLGAEVDYNDPHVPQTHYMRRWGDIGKKSVPLTAESIGRYDCVVIATNHSAYDYDMIGRTAQLIIDSRNAMAGCANPSAAVIKA